MGSSSSFRTFGTSSSAMHRLKKFLCDLYLTALSLNQFSFSAICSLFLLDDPSSREQCVVSLYSSQIVLMFKFARLVLSELAHLVFFWMVFSYFLILRLVFVLKNIAD